MSSICSSNGKSVRLAARYGTAYAAPIPIHTDPDLVTVSCESRPLSDLKFRWILLLAISILIALSSGCASLSREEIALQTLHAADVMQTLQIAKNTCNYSESDPITKKIIGENPSESSVLAWGVGSALLFHYVSQRADEAEGWKRAAWYGAMLLTRGQIILGNEKEGIHLTSVDKECP